MAIYKGQLMNQETKDILYPQTSTDMVDGLEELLEQGVMVADTLPIGSVIGWDNEEPYPTDIYEEVIYNPKQLLINPDLQINQREQSEYTTTAIDRINTVDMWGIIASNTTTKLTVLDKGVKLENQGTGASVLTQRINIEKVSNYTVVLKVNNIVGNVICEIYHIGGIYGTYTLKNGINVIEIKNSSFQDVSPTINGQGSAEFEYINLFEGDIAYPHVKNNYAYDLMECQQYVYVIKPKTRFNISLLIGNTSAYLTLLMPTQFKNKPTISITDREFSYYLDNSGVVSKNIDSVGIITINGNFITVELIGTFNNEQWRNAIITSLGIVISCEPL